MDVLIGNGDVDSLYGESGKDYFVAESIEIRDLETYESYSLPTASEFSVYHARSIDPEGWSYLMQD